jgi:hypothetical protein
MCGALSCGCADGLMGNMRVCEEGLRRGARSCRGRARGHSGQPHLPGLSDEGLAEGHRKVSHDTHCCADQAIAHEAGAARRLGHLYTWCTQ